MVLGATGSTPLVLLPLVLHLAALRWVSLKAGCEIRIWGEVALGGDGPKKQQQDSEKGDRRGRPA